MGVCVLGMVLTVMTCAWGCVAVGICECGHTCAYLVECTRAWVTEHKHASTCAIGSALCTCEE